MADPDDTIEETIDDILSRPHRYDFFAAVRQLQAKCTEHPPIAQTAHRAEDAIIFEAAGSPAVRGSALGQVARRSGGGFSLAIESFGLIGHRGPLPSHITELADEQNTPTRKGALSSFLDIFHHRLIGLLYRTWEAGNLAASYDRAPTGVLRRRRGEPPYTTYLNALIGIAPREMQDRDALPDDAKRYFAGHLTCPQGTAAAISGMASKLVGAAVDVTEFVPEWLPMSVDDQTRLGNDATAELGRTAILGTRFMGWQSRVALKTAPLTYPRFADLLPSGTLFPALRDAMRAVVGLAVGWQITPVLKAEEIPPLQLNGERALGWDTWLGPSPGGSDADNVQLDGAYRGTAG